jgi:RAT1-interacting protein
MRTPGPYNVLTCGATQGCLYLEDANSPTKLAKKANSEASYRQQSYYGYSFEAFSTTSNPQAYAADSFEPPNTNVQWCSVVKTNLGGFRTILGGEVDCVQPGTDPRRIDPSRFIELKTNIMIQSPREEAMFER